METKKCGRCKEVKWLSDFYIDNYTKSGLGSYCKVCKKEQDRLSSLKNIEKRKEREKKARQKLYTKNWKGNNQCSWKAFSIYFH